MLHIARRHGGNGHIPVDDGCARAYFLPMAPDFEIDARDLLCPLPVLRLRKCLAKAAPGQLIRLIATDPAALIDVPHFCTEQGHSYLGATDQPDGSTAHLIRHKP